MGFALFAFSSLYQPLRRIAGSMRARPAPHGPSGQPSAAYLAGAKASNDPLCAATDDHATPQTAAGAVSVGHMPGPAPAAMAPRPLRVIFNRHEGKACRLVISGRMADVCAELDRLALH